MISRRIRMALAALAALALLGAATQVLLLPHLTSSVADTFGQGDYRLQTTDGGSFTADTLRGSPSAVFFGYTHCPDVCPTTLGEIAAWQDELSREGKSLRVFFITVDPERDPVEVLKDYVAWVPGVTGVSGSADETAKVVKAFRIYAQKVEQANGQYAMDHTASVFLFDASGRLVEPIGYGEDEGRAMAKLRRLLR